VDVGGKAIISPAFSGNDKRNPTIPSEGLAKNRDGLYYRTRAALHQRARGEKKAPTRKKRRELDNPVILLSKMHRTKAEGEGKRPSK